MTRWTALWQQVIEHLDAGIVLVDRDLTVRFWNPWMETRTCVPVSQVEGKPIAARFPNLKASGIEGRLADAVALGTSAIFSHAFHEAPFPSRGGPCGTEAPRYQEVKALPLREGDEVVGLALLVYDVTDLVVRQFAMTEAARELSRVRQHMESLDSQASTAAPMIARVLALLEAKG